MWERGRSVQRLRRLLLLLLLLLVSACIHTDRLTD